MKLKPFDLKEAMAGKPVVTRDGRGFLFGGFNPNAMENVQIVGWVSGNCEAYSNTGRYITGSESDNDLFMATKKIVRWVNVYPNTSDAWRTEAMAEIARGPDCIACIRIEFEEGEGLS